MKQGGGQMKRGGFTLVELIAVIIILGILAAIGIPQYRRAMERARGAEAYAGLGQVQQAEKILYTTDQKYFTTKAENMTNNEMRTLDIFLPQTGWNFRVESNDVNLRFTVTARRREGPCAANATGNTVVADETGTITDNWKDCVGDL